MKSGKEAPRVKTRLTKVKYAGRALGKSDYHVLKFIAQGRLEVEKVDDTVCVVVASLERLQRELAV
jgi:hypothetical protein